MNDIYIAKKGEVNEFGNPETGPTKSFNPKDPFLVLVDSACSKSGGEKQLHCRPRNTAKLALSDYNLQLPALVCCFRLLLMRFQ